MRLFLNTLAVTSTAMFAGVLLAIGVVLGGYWRGLPAAGFLASFADMLPYVTRVIPMVVLPTLAGLAGSLWLSRGERDARALWLWAGACVVALLVLTVAWFAPTNGQFAARSLPANAVLPKRDAWLTLHTARIALAAAASVLGALAARR